jgi:glycerol uptake facilitator-like aquaporin
MMRRKLASEFLGTATLIATVVGSGAMATALSNDIGIQLLINTIATVFVLYILITLLGPISGAHFNPVVSLVQLVGKSQKISETLSYIVAQVIGAIAGAILANFMFDQEALQISTRAREGFGLLLGEVIATAGLIAIIGILSKREQSNLIPVAVAAWIGSAYFFTSSTSFANPAVTIGRVFSNTFAGIEPGSVLPFIAAQLVGAALGMLAVRAVTKTS